MHHLYAAESLAPNPLQHVPQQQVQGDSFTFWQPTHPGRMGPPRAPYAHQEDWQHPSLYRTRDAACIGNLMTAVLGPTPRHRSAPTSLSFASVRFHCLDVHCEAGSFLIVLYPVSSTRLPLLYRAAAVSRFLCLQSQPLKDEAEERQQPGASTSGRPPAPPQMSSKMVSTELVRPSVLCRTFCYPHHCPPRLAHVLDVCIKAADSMSRCPSVWSS